MKRAIVLAIAAVAVFTACTSSSTSQSTTSAAIPSTVTAPPVQTVTTGPTTTTLPPWEPPPHPIQIHNSAFVDGRTGDEFVVRGANYLTRILVGTGYEDRTFSPAVFDRDRVATDFEALTDRGYNTVRIFMDSCSQGPACIGSDTGDGLNGAYLDVMVELMRLAKDSGLFLLLTSNDLPDDGGYWEISSIDDAGVFPGYRNSHYMTASGEEAARTYWSDLMGGLASRRAPFDVVLGWSILNEQWMFKDQYPLVEGSGVVTTKTGSYDSADTAQRHAMVIDGIRSYVDTVAEVIRGHDPHGLVTMGFFAPQFPNPTSIGGDWYVDTSSLVESSTLDFFDFHAYAGEDVSLAEMAENFGLPSDKPVVMGEVGAFIDRYSDVERAGVAIQNWYAASCALGFDGWLYWEMLPADLSIGDATWALTAQDNYLLDALAPVNQPDPCTPTLVSPNLALGKDVSASRSLEEEPASNAVDGDPTSQWGSGADSAQWIEVDLGEPTEIGGFNLLVAQWPEGRTTHVITVDGEQVANIDGDTAGGDTLSVILEAPVIGQLVRVTTVRSPSWVAWSEIEVLAA